MKGLILCGGRGTRLRPFTYAGAKHFLPVANKPVVYYIIEALKRAGIEDIYVVVGEREKEFRLKLGDGDKWCVSIEYIRQHSPLGLAHAVMSAEGRLRGETFVTVLGDNLIMHSIRDLVEHHIAIGAQSTILLSPVEDPRRFGMATLKGRRITGLVEKPERPAGNNAIVGMYVLSSIIFDAIKKTKPSARGELELTDAIMEMIREGYLVGYKVTGEWWSDVGRPEDLLAANQRILKGIKGITEGSIISNSIVGEKVMVEKGALVKNSVIEDFVVIGEKAVVKGAHIGPYTSIGDGSSVTDTNIKNSIIMKNCVLEGMHRGLDMSIIGEGSIITESMGKETTSMWIGRDSIIKGQ